MYLIKMYCQNNGIERMCMWKKDLRKVYIDVFKGKIEDDLYRLHLYDHNERNEWNNVYLKHLFYYKSSLVLTKKEQICLSDVFKIKTTKNHTVMAFMLENKL